MASNECAEGQAMSSVRVVPPEIDRRFLGWQAHLLSNVQKLTQVHTDGSQRQCDEPIGCPASHHRYRTRPMCKCVPSLDHVGIIKAITNHRHVPIPSIHGVVLSPHGRYNAPSSCGNEMSNQGRGDISTDQIDRHHRVTASILKIAVKASGTGGLRSRSFKGESV